MNTHFGPCQHGKKMMNRCITLLSLCLLIGAQNLDAQPFAYRQGVSLSHWTGNMIDDHTYADSAWFNKKDVEWIARTGVDHIQVYVAGNEIISVEGVILPEKIAALDSLINWSRGLGLGVLISPGRMPAFIPDSTLSKEAQTELRLKKQVDYMGVFANYFRNHGDNIRFMITAGGDDHSIRSRYFAAVITEIRKTNPSRKLYVMAYSINHLPDLYIPKNDSNIIVSAEMSQSSEAKSEAIDVFVWQHQEYYFSKGVPSVTFPGTVPKLDTFTTDLSKWAIKFSGAGLRKDYFETKFKTVKKWMTENHPDLEFYVPYWRYWTGYPFDPATIKDKHSVQNFINAFVNAAKKNNITWCFYDYNSGSSIRYESGEESFLLKTMRLKRTAGSL